MEIDIPKSMFSPYNIAYMYVFRSYHLVLESHLACSSLGKVTAPAPSFSELNRALCVELRPPGLSPIQFGTFVSVYLCLVHV